MAILLCSISTVVAMSLAGWTAIGVSPGGLPGNAQARYLSWQVIPQAAALQRCRDLYLGEIEPGTPLASGLFADLSGLPDTCVFASSEEVQLDDSKRLVERLHQAGVRAMLSVWVKVPHVFPLLAPFIPEAVYPGS